jgi:hypothetical protein
MEKALLLDYTFLRRRQADCFFQEEKILRKRSVRVQRFFGLRDRGNKNFPPPE